MGDPFGGDEGGDFDFVDAGVAEELDEVEFVVGGDDAGLVLEAVAWGDVGDADGFGHVVMVIACRLLGGQVLVFRRNTA